MVDAFRMADEVLLHGVGGITDLITTPGLINVDFADVQGGHEGRRARRSWASAGPPGRTAPSRRRRKAIASPMLETVDGGRAAGVLLSIAGPSNLSLHEVNTAAIAISEHCDPDANVIFGAIVDDILGEEMRVTVIAAGFDARPQPALAAGPGGGDPAASAGRAAPREPEPRARRGRGASTTSTSRTS